MGGSKIEWTDETWNPTTGCTKISPGCLNCYAERLSKRLKAMGVPKYSNAFQITLHRETLCVPQQWKRPRLVFVDSMSDLFHELVPEPYVSDVFAVMAGAGRHRFQVLTKRSARLQSLSAKLRWQPNIWMGVSVENEDYCCRVEHLRKTGAHVKFLSLEPLLGPIPRLDLTDIDWVIVGGESGPGARPMREEWVLQIRDRCVAAGVPFFFKQWGGALKKQTGRVLAGRTWDQMPPASRTCF